MIDWITSLVRRFSTNTRNSRDKRYPCHSSIVKTTIWRDRWWTKWLFVGQRHETTVLPPVVLHYRSIDEESRLRQEKWGASSPALFSIMQILVTRLPNTPLFPVTDRFRFLFRFYISLIYLLTNNFSSIGNTLFAWFISFVCYKNNCEIFLCRKYLMKKFKNIFSCI